MKFKLVYVAITSLILGFNVRIPGRAKIEELFQDIHDNGLQVPPTAYETKAGPEIIAGHLRTECLNRLYDEHPARFKELFPDGVPINMIEGITYEQAQDLKVDHGNENPLLDPMEAQLCANLLFDSGKTEQQVAVRLAGMMDRLKPMKADKRKELLQKEADLALYIEAGKTDLVVSKQQEIDKFKLDYRKGWIQNMKAAWRCPHVVLATLYAKSTGEANWPDNLGLSTPRDTYLPLTLQIDEVKRLWTAFSQDLEIVVDGKKPYNKRIPGPNFNARWTTVVDKAKKKETEEPTVRTKAFSKTELEDDEAKWNSQFAKMLAAHHRREVTVDVNLLKAHDDMAYFAEIVADRAPKAWEDMVLLAKGLEKEIAANNAEVEAKEADTEIKSPPPVVPVEKPTSAKVIKEAPKEPKTKKQATK